MNNYISKETHDKFVCGACVCDIDQFETITPCTVFVAKGDEAPPCCLYGYSDTHPEDDSGFLDKSDFVEEKW
jgi:hypothetical protein